MSAMKENVVKQNKQVFDQILASFKFGDQIEKEEKKLGYIKSITPVYDSYQLVVLYANWIEDKTNQMDIVLSNRQLNSLHFL